MTALPARTPPLPLPQFPALSPPSPTQPLSPHIYEPRLIDHAKAKHLAAAIEAIDNAIEQLNAAEQHAKNCGTNNDSRIHIKAARLIVESQAILLREHRQ